MTRRGGRFAVVFAPFVLAFCILFIFTLSGCEKVGAKTEEQARASESDILGYYQDLLTFPRSGPSYPDGIDDYLLEQAEILGVDARGDARGNVVMRAAATAGMEEARPLVLIAYTGADIINDRSKSFDPYTDGVRLEPSDENVRAEGTSMGADGAIGAATILAVLKRAVRHGDITAYFAIGDGSARAADALAPQESGATADSFDVPEDAVVIEIGVSDTGVILTGAPTATLLEASCSAVAANAGNGRAYVIAASGFPSRPAGVGRGEDEDGYVNPISIVARILTETKSAGCVYGLSDFSGGSDACLTPAEAQATVVLVDYEERQFRRIFDDIAEEAVAAAGGADGGAEVKMIETTLPSSVIGEDDVSKALTYIYGLMSIGTTESDDLAAVVNIGEISLTPMSFDCGIAVVGHDAENVKQAVSEQFAFERLSGVPVRATGEIPGFGGAYVSSDESAGGDAQRGMSADASSTAGAAVALGEAYLEATGDDASYGVSDAVSPLGKYAGDATVLNIGITVNDKETTGEQFSKGEAAIPANVILEYLTKL
jgi:dipeptidase D